MRRLRFRTKVVIGLIAVVLMFLLYVVTAYNTLVAKHQQAEQTLSGVSIQLQRRADLIPNLVNTVKGYAAHEEKVFADVTAAREKMMGATTPAEVVAADNEISATLGRVLAVAEAYPELKANENFLSLQDEISGSENRISVARQDFNAQATSFNTYVRSFPKNLVAKVFNFKELALFVAQRAAETAPVVSFE
ncbi:MAG: LemA family protein [Oscillospiraceae bacterium]|nr:LemA family protein [Oscillospiraceae bacterium]